MNNLPKTNTNPLSWLQSAMSRWSQKGKFPSLKFNEVTLTQTIHLISELSNSTTFGTDCIDALAIKVVAPQLAPPIRHLINTSLKTSQYANKWKLSKLLPLLKSSDLNRLHPSSYRPIAILPTISKIVEKAAQMQILNYLETNRMLNWNTHAYRKGHSTTTALAEVTEKLYKAIDERKISSLMTLDQSAAFDCVQHSLLLDKLELYYLDKTVVKWVKSYLENRTQFVTIGRANSRMTAVGRGVPQGSVLGPLLYTIFTNEMSETIVDEDCTNIVHKNTESLFSQDCDKCGSVTQYADDATYQTADRLRSNNQKQLIEKPEESK